MPWRLLFFLLILTLVVIFSGFNITNTSDISFGFYTFHDIPIFISLFLSFLLGCFIMLPFTVFKRKPAKTKKPKKEKKHPTNKKTEQNENALPPNIKETHEKTGEIDKNGEKS